jgi:SAM-dependent methyltransferase
MEINRKPSKNSVSAIEKAARRIIALAPKEDKLGLPTYLEHHVDRLALDFEWTLNNIKKSATILEIGAFPFFLTAALSDAGYSIQTLDMDTDDVRVLAASANVRMIPCDIEREKFPVLNSSFDEVIFNEVFEHLRIDVIFTFEEIMRVLKPSGRLWLSTPNLTSLRGLINLLIKREAWSCVGGGIYSQWKNLRTIGCMGHVREYTGPEVLHFLRDVGFQRQKLIYRGQFKNLAAQIVAGTVPSLSPYFSIVADKRRQPASG